MPVPLWLGSPEGDVNMNAIVQFVLQHGYLILFAAVFAGQAGLPIPAPLFLLAAGALAATGKLSLVAALGLSITACVLADWAWYEAGRRGGDRILHFIHRFARDPKAADRRAKQTFARHGPKLLVVAKFVPGLDFVMPPLAGSAGVSRFRFFVFESVAASLWSGVSAGLGFVLSQDLERAAAYVARAGTLAAGLLFAAGSIYLGRKLARCRRFAGDVPLTRITPADAMGTEGSIAGSCAGSLRT